MTTTIDFAGAVSCKGIYLYILGSIYSGVPRYQAWLYWSYSGSYPPGTTRVYINIYINGLLSTPV